VEKFKSQKDNNIKINLTQIEESEIEMKDLNDGKEHKD
jgi:hypothetical protein